MRWKIDEILCCSLQRRVLIVLWKIKNLRWLRVESQSRCITEECFFQDNVNSKSVTRSLGHSTGREKKLKHCSWDYVVIDI